MATINQTAFNRLVEFIDKHINDYFGFPVADIITSEEFERGNIRDWWDIRNRIVEHNCDLSEYESRMDFIKNCASSDDYAKAEKLASASSMNHHGEWGLFDELYKDYIDDQLLGHTDEINELIAACWETDKEEDKEEINEPAPVLYKIIDVIIHLPGTRLQEIYNSWAHSKGYNDLPLCNFADNQISVAEWILAHPDCLTQEDYDAYGKYYSRRIRDMVRNCKK